MVRRNERELEKSYERSSRGASEMLERSFRVEGAEG